jgi:PhnB protein
MQVNPYLYFKGNCEEALGFYERALGAKVLVKMKHSEAPVDTTNGDPAWADKILHARMEVGGTAVMASDTPPQHYHEPAGFSLSVSTKDPAEADQIFAALSEGGTVSMPIQETFWAQRFGRLKDKYGTNWMVNCEKPMPQGA